MHTPAHLILLTGARCALLFPISHQVPVPLAQRIDASASPPCAQAIADQSGGPCLRATSVPTLGMLFPPPHDGGRFNEPDGSWSFIGGGLANRTFASQGVIGGGRENYAAGAQSVIGGGSFNIADGEGAFIGGGGLNYAFDEYASVGGGADNVAGFGATVPGGWGNDAAGPYSFAAGRRASALHGGAFVWGDSQDTAKTSSAADQFNVYASGGTRVFAGTSPALVVAPDGKVGIGTSSPTRRLSVAGEICATGAIGSCSDARFKTRVEPLEDGMEKVLELRAVRFDWRISEFPEQAFDADRQVGFLAQDVARVVPEVVAQGSDGTLSIDYGKLTAVLTAALQEQQREIEDLRRELRRVADRVESLETPELRCTDR